MRGYLWIFNWWWPYSPNPSCPLALKNDLKILICSFCFVSSFHFAIPLQPRVLWSSSHQPIALAGWARRPGPLQNQFFIFYFYSAIFYWSKNWKNGNSLTSVFLLLAVADSDFWNLRLEKKHEKKKQWPMKLNTAKVTQHADCCRQLNVEREKMNFNIICYSVLCD